MDFHETRFPANLSFGSVGGPERRTEIVTLANGFEERNTPWAHSRRRYDAGVAMASLDDLELLIAFFEARQGQLCGFRWKDWSDFKSCQHSAEIFCDDQLLGSGDGALTEFQLCKHYQSGGQGYTRPIIKPVAGSIKVAVNAVELTEGVDFSADPATGRVAFAAAPAAGVPVTAGFEFDVPVRFDTDTIQVAVASFQAGEAPSVPIVEVRV
ncbi:MAG: DUF2460 domain-containing protein [Pseudomonadota bacterium]